MSDHPRVFVILTKTALAFIGAVLVWVLLVSSFGVGAVGAALVGLAASLAFTAAITPAVGCVVLSHSRQDALWLMPIAGLVGAFGGVLAFHHLLQLLTSGVPSALPDDARRAQAAGSVVVWAVMSASMLLVAVVSRTSKIVRTLSALAGVGFAVVAGMWAQALGV